MDIEIYRSVGEQTQDVPPTANSDSSHDSMPQDLVKSKWSSSVPFTKNMDAGTGTPPLNYASTSALVVLMQGKEPLVTPSTLQKKCPYAHISLKVQEPRGKRSPDTHSFFLALASDPQCGNSSSMNNSDVVIIGYCANGTSLKSRGSTTTVSDVGNEGNASSFPGTTSNDLNRL